MHFNTFGVQIVQKNLQLKQTLQLIALLVIRMNLSFYHCLEMASKFIQNLHLYLAFNTT